MARYNKQAGVNGAAKEHDMAMMGEQGGGERGTIRVTLGGEVRWTDQAGVWGVADELHKRHGGVPEIVDTAAVAVPDTLPAILAAEPVATPDTIPAPAPDQEVVVAIPEAAKGRGLVALSARSLRWGDVSAEGAARSTADYEAAVKAGFSPRQPYYDRGTAVIETGVQNARKFRQAWEKLPLTTQGCAEVAETVRAEERSAFPACRISSLAMADDAALVLDIMGQAAQRPMTPTAFAGMVSRLGLGGAQYLAKCWPELRAHNVNAWLARLTGDELRAIAEAAVTKTKYSPTEFVFRDRKNAASGEREIFATVTPDYTAWDVDLVAEAVRLATPPEARGRVTYDGDKARIEVLFHSTVQPANYVAGEFFRAGVVIKTDDTGGGSLQGSAHVWQNLCLNLIYKASAGAFRIRHIGSLDALVARFKAGFAAALGTLDHFTEAWGFASGENAVERAVKAADERPVSIEEGFPGLLRGIIDRELVPVFAKREDAVPRLLEMWRRDESSATAVTRGSRAAVVNSFTRYAHEAVELTPWQEDEIHAAAGRLLQDKRPLPYMTPEEADKKH